MTKTTHYLHCDKCEVADQCRDEGITDDDHVTSVIGAIYEVEFEIDADTGTILAVRSGKQTLK
jgi:hypothetical protein